MNRLPASTRRQLLPHRIPETTDMRAHVPAADQRNRRKNEEKAPRATRLLPLCAALMLVASPAFANFQAHRLSAAETLKLDGRLDEPAWQLAPVNDTFFENAPLDKVPAKSKTEVRLVYDSKYLYVGIKAYDPDPSRIRAPFFRRDKISGDQDFIGLFIDAAGTHKGAQLLYFNPRGAFADGMFDNENGEDYAFDYDAQVVTGRFDGGWSAEVRIPFSAVTYDAANPNWNLLVFRNMVRGQRYKDFSAPVTKSSNCLICYAQPIDGLRDLPSGLNWTATPQLVLRKGRDRWEGKPERDYSGHDLSLDLKVRPDSATVIDATINPDFSQIELDAPQLSGNTRFALFVPEKRPFFLEGSDILQTPFRAIYTRAITDPNWGARVTRRDGKTDVIVLTTHDAGGGQVLIPKSYNTDYAVQDFASRATIARALYKGDQFTFGALLSDRTLMDGRGYNRLLGTDFRWQRSNTARLSGQLLMSSTTAQPDAHGELRQGPRTAGHAATLNYHSETDNYAFDGALEDVSTGFRDDNGFISQAGERMWGTELTKKFGKTGIWNDFNLYLHAERKFDPSGNVIYNDYTPGLFVRGPHDVQLNVRVRPLNAIRIKQDGELFRQRTVWAKLDAAPGRVLAHVSATVELGDEIEYLGSRRGKGGVVALSGTLRPHDRIELAPMYSVTWVDGRGGPEDGQRLYTEQAFQLNGIYHFGPRDSVRMVVQKSRTTRNPGFYLFPVPAHTRGQTGSVVYEHAAGLGTAAYVGLTLSDGETPGYDPRHRQDELFVKLSWRL